MINRGAARLERVLRDFADERTVGVTWDERVVDRVKELCKPFNEPHFVMMNAPCREGYELSVKLMGYGTVLDAHAGVKGAGGKPRIAHEVDLNNQVHYQLQCYQATHGSTMHGISLAHQLISGGKLPKLGLMTGADERFRPDQTLEAIRRASTPDSLKVIIDWD
jgi:hypothetical protein